MLGAGENEVARWVSYGVGDVHVVERDVGEGALHMSVRARGHRVGPQVVAEEEWVPLVQSALFPDVEVGSTTRSTRRARRGRGFSTVSPRLVHGAILGGRVVPRQRGPWQRLTQPAELGRNCMK